MKKIITLLITAILLTGCQAEYNINITENNIEDSIKIYTDSNKVQSATNKTTKEFEDTLSNWERGYEYYKRELYTTDKHTGYNYTYSFNYDEYDAMSQLRKCYNDFELGIDSNKISLKTSNEFICKSYYQEINNITITITSDYVITNSNSDTSNKNTHTWTINQNNYKNKPIEINIDKTQKYVENKPKESNLIKILTIIVFILLVIVLIVTRKDKKRR